MLTGSIDNVIEDDFLEVDDVVDLPSWGGARYRTWRGPGAS